MANFYITHTQISAITNKLHNKFHFNTYIDYSDRFWLFLIVIFREHQHTRDIYIYIYIYIIHNLTFLAVNGKIQYIIKISMCGVDNVAEQ